jgi:hypothetical protein
LLHMLNLLIPLLHQHLMQTHIKLINPRYQIWKLPLTLFEIGVSLVEHPHCR